MLFLFPFSFPFSFFPTFPPIFCARFSSLETSVIWFVVEFNFSEVRHNVKLQFLKIFRPDSHVFERHINPPRSKRADGKSRSSTRKFDSGLTHVQRQDLHWLDVIDRIRYRLFKCLHSMAPKCLCDLCTPVDERSTHTSATQAQFLIVSIAKSGYVDISFLRLNG